MNIQSKIENSITKTLLSLMPIPILGSALTEILDFRGKLKQERLNSFTELLENYFSNHQGINLDNFQTEEFSDLFESVLKRVVLTSSIEKMKHFKAILIKQIENPKMPISDSELYLDIISEFSEMEIMILFEYRKYYEESQPLVVEKDKLEYRKANLNIMLKPGMPLLEQELRQLTGELANINFKLNSLYKINDADYFSISDDLFKFYKQRLFSKALLIDTGVGSIGKRPFESMNITQFGIKFIDFIVSSN